MNKFLGRLAVTLILLGVTGAVCIWLALAMGESTRSRQVLTSHLIAPRIGSDVSTLERGRYLFEVRGCANCHGSDGRGREFARSEQLRIVAPNITPAVKATGAYRPEDWDQAIRHGVSPSGRPLQIMPSDEVGQLSDDELSALVSFLASLPPADGESAVIDLPFAARIMYGLGLTKDAAAKIDHQRAPRPHITKALSSEYGAHLAKMCIGCHGADLAGGRVPGAPPEWPRAPSLNGPTGGMSTYPTAQDLQAMFRSGKRGDGSTIRVMPFQALRVWDDTDVGALHLYLMSQ